MDHLILGLLNLVAFIFCTYTQHTTSQTITSSLILGGLAGLNLVFAISNIAFWLYQ